MAGKGGTTTKLFVGNLPVGCQKNELQELFSLYGTVVECDVIRDYGFVHFTDPEEAKNATAALDQYMFNGVHIKVQVSHSRVRSRAGMGERDKCYRCGQEGHWSKECPTDGGGPSSRRSAARGPSSYMPAAAQSDYLPMGAAAAAAAAASMSRYHPYAIPDRRAMPAPPVPAAAMAAAAAAAASVAPTSVSASYYHHVDEFGRPTPDYYASQRVAVAAPAARPATYDYAQLQYGQYGEYGAATTVPLATTAYTLASARKSTLPY